MANDEDSKPPRLRVVAENTDDAIRRNRTFEDIEGPLRELAANVLRVVRGAGKPYELAFQCRAYLTAIAEHHEAGGLIDEASIRSMVSIREAIDYKSGPEEIDWQEGQEGAIAGALAIAAARVVAQRTQERAGDREFGEGWRAMARIMEARQIRMRSEVRKAKSEAAKTAKRVKSREAARSRRVAKVL